MGERPEGIIMDQTNIQPMATGGQQTTPKVDFPKIKTGRRNWMIVITAALSVLALTIFGFSVINRGRDSEKPSYFSKIKIGRTTSGEVKRMYGEPAKITSLDGADVYLYPAAKAPFMHQVVFSREKGKVLLVNEFVGGDSTLTLNDFINRHKQYDREFFTAWGEDSRVYVFSKSGLLLHVDAPSGRVIEVGYFSPGKDDEVIQIMGKYLLSEPPKRL